MATYVVAGITGNVGGAAASRLLEAGHAVRALVRNLEKAQPWAERGVELVHGEFTNVAALEQAFTGVDGAFVMVPPNVAPEPGMPDSRAVVDALRSALTRITPPKVVALSSIGSEQTSGLGLITATHWLEQALSGLTVPVAFVRAGGFYENDVPGLKGAVASGTLYSLYGPEDRAYPMVATADIGATVAELLLTEWTGRRIIELGTPMTPTQLAAAVSEVAGRTVTARSIPAEHLAATLERFGIPKGRTGPMEEMVNGINTGWIHFGVPGTEARPGTTGAADVYRPYLQA